MQTAPSKPVLTLPTLLAEAVAFSATESAHDEPSLFGVTDGKTIGTYLEHKFVAQLMEVYSFAGGNSGAGIDIPSVNVDIKVTSIKQPQSSCPFKSARQKIYGLGYHLIVFVYEKSDEQIAKTSRLNIRHTIFIEKERTGDYQTTRGLRERIERDGNADDIVAFLEDCHLPVDDIQAHEIAEYVLSNKPEQGYLAFTSALQWRLRYQRVIDQAGIVPGIQRIS